METLWRPHQRSVATTAPARRAFSVAESGHGTDSGFSSSLEDRSSRSSPWRSCVEAGRWAPVSREFRTAGHVLHSDSRRRKVAQVSFSLSHNGTPRARQDRVWDDVASLFELHQVESPTSRLADVFRARGRDLSRYVAAFPAVDGQAGAVFALAGRRLSGAALVVEDHVVHLCAFRTEDGDMDRLDNPAGPVGRIVPASRRRRR